MPTGVSYPVWPLETGARKIGPWASWIVMCWSLSDTIAVRGGMLAGRNSTNSWRFAGRAAAGSTNVEINPAKETTATMARHCLEVHSLTICEIRSFDPGVGQGGA